jgi:hypothetical protein
MGGTLSLHQFRTVKNITTNQRRSPKFEIGMRHSFEPRDPDVYSRKCNSSGGKYPVLQRLFKSVILLVIIICARTLSPYKRNSPRGEYPVPYCPFTALILPGTSILRQTVPLIKGVILLVMSILLHCPFKSVSLVLARFLPGAECFTTGSSSQVNRNWLR